MKKVIKLITILFIGMVIMYSCKQENEYVNDDLVKVDKNILSKLNKENVSFLKDKIENIFIERKFKVKKINSIKKYGKLFLVSFLTDNSKTNSIAFEKLLDVNGFNNKFSDYYVYCTGSCDCNLEGVLGPDGGYVQCKCTDCVMHWSPKYIEKRVNNITGKYDVEKLAYESFKKTFNLKPKELKVLSLQYNEYVKAKVYTITYSDINNKKSTFLLIKDYNYKNNKMFTDYTVDCYGSCDCRERFIPKTGAIECTCGECKMDIKEIK